CVDPYARDVGSRLTPPVWRSGGSAAHLLGTDPLGRDLLARMLVGIRISIMIGGASVILGLLVGVGLGLIAGYFGGLIDTVVMRIVDGILAIPPVLFALTVLAVIGGGIVNLILVIAFSQWMT